MLTLIVASILLVEAAGATRYVGCFEDPNFKDLPGVTISNKKVKKCLDFCMSEDYQTSTNRKGCYCGESYGQGPLPAGRCFAYCPRIPAKECLGTYTDSVWYTGEEGAEEGLDSADSGSSDISSRQKLGVEDEGVVYIGSLGSYGAGRR